MAIPRGMEETGMVWITLPNGYSSLFNSSTLTLYECQLLTSRNLLSAVLEMTLGVLPVLISGTLNESVLSLPGYDTVIFFLSFSEPRSLLLASRESTLIGTIPPALWRETHKILSS